MKKFAPNLLAWLSGSDSAREHPYRRISMEEARRLIEGDEKYTLLDVRTPGEYRSGHIPGAINVPNEEIGEKEPKALPDREQPILVYCRSGNRSRQAAGKLAKLGYSNVLDMGGILYWPGAVVSE